MDRTPFLALASAWAVGAPACATVDAPEPESEVAGGGAPSSQDDQVASEQPTNSSDATPAGASGGSASTGGRSTGGSSLGGETSSGGLQQVPNCQLDMDCDDSDPCTDDVCAGGFCSSEDNGSCECRPSTAATDCDDANECTDDDCVDYECVHQSNESSCEDDGDACTLDVCSAMSCTHPDSGLCGEETVILRSMREDRTGQWISLDADSALVWNVATNSGQAAPFNQVDTGGGNFQLQALGNELWVELDENDDLAATASEQDAMVFEAPICGAGVGLNATSDDDGGSFVAAEPGGELKARSGGCDGSSAVAWERFEVTAVGGS